MVNTSDILPNTPRYLKVPLIFFNGILWILGLLLIILGAIVLNELKNVDGLDINVGLSAGLVVLGVFLIILTVVGSVVAYKEQLVGLIVYTVIILILLICLIGVGGAAFSYRNDTDKALDTAWAKASDPIRTRLEQYFDCCGWNGEHFAPADISFDADGKHHEEQCMVLLPPPTPAPTTAPVPTTEPPTTTPTTPATEAPTTAPTAPPTSPPTAEPSQTPSPPPSTSTGARKRDDDPTSVPTTAPTVAPTPAPPQYQNYTGKDCRPQITDYVSNRLYVAGVAGIVIGVIEFVCMFFSLYLVVRLCRNPRARSYD